MLIKLIKQNAVLIIAFAAAAASVLFVPISAEYLDYIDWRVLCLLFCLMAVVAGLEDCGVFEVFAQRLLAGEKSLRLLCVLLVVLPFFFSMVITNDVALITFVPFTILIFSMIKRPEYLIYIIVMQTAAANLGSMMTPIGNPQNLYLYSHYGISAAGFVACLLPFAAISLVAVVICACAVKQEKISVGFEKHAKIKAPAKMAIFIGLLVLCLASVFRVVNYIVLTVIVVICLAIFARRIFKKVDYALLLTFVCFFVFSGNMAKIPAVQEVLTKLLSIDGVVASAAVSQVISNVPAAVLLSGFTEDWRALLVGTNIGGLGTLIASLASLISFQFYIKTDGARPGKYLLVFTAANLVGLVILLAVNAFIPH